MRRLLDEDDVIEAISSEPLFESGMKKRDADAVVPVIYEKIKSLPSAQAEQQHGRIFQGVVVEYPEYCTYPEYKGKPYFSIKYTENGKEFIGYGTYKPEVLSEFLKEYFMLPAQPERETAKFIRWMECKRTADYISYTPHCKCSKCGTEFLIETIKYCYMRGARMER